MKILHKAFFGLTIYAATFLVGCQIESQDPFVRHVEDYRYSKDSFFRMAEQSPLDPQFKRNFNALTYYEVDKNYSVKARFEALQSPKSFFIEETDGNNAEYYKMGILHFELNNKKCSLSV